VREVAVLDSVITGAAFFTSMRHDIVRMVPVGVPHPRLVVALTGATQIVAGAALAVPVATTTAAGVLAMVMVAKVPANLKASREGLIIRGPLPTPPALRIPLLCLWLALLCWIARPR
jgi:uncharacterized membrane protein